MVRRSTRAFAARPLRKAIAGVACGMLASLLALPAIANASTHSHASLAPYVFGMSYPESGPLAPPSNGDNRFIQAWFNYVNAHGGIQGHKVKLIALDDAGDPGKSLLNVETLWSQDHVLGFIYEAGYYTAWSYIKQNNIPVWSFSGGAGNRGFASAYPTWFPTGSLQWTWNSQAAYWSVKIMHQHPKTVAVLYNPALSNFNSYEQKYWQKLGATQIYFDAGTGSPSSDCTARVLKWKSENVQYVDIQDASWPSCLLAEQRLGWKPALAQGGPTTSQIGEAELLGKAVVGMIAGSPTAQYTGAPIIPHPDAVSRTYVQNIKTYAPQFANYSFLNGTGQLVDYSTATLVTAVLSATLQKYHRVTPSLLIKTTQKLKNWNTFTMVPPVASFSRTCKTGGDGTTWGYWHYNPHPTAARPSIYEVPTSGPHWVTTRTFLGFGKCYLTQISNQLYPNG